MDLRLVLDSLHLLDVRREIGIPEAGHHEADRVRCLRGDDHLQSAQLVERRRDKKRGIGAYVALAPRLAPKEGPDIVIVLKRDPDGLEVRLDVVRDFAPVDEEDRLFEADEQVRVEDGVERDVVPAQVQYPR